MIKRTLLSIAILVGLTTLLVLILISTFNANADMITVDDDGGADYLHIQDAINVSNDGDTVFVYAGTYYENVKINKSINLIGEDRDTTIINGNDMGNVIEVVANNTNIRGFTIRNHETIISYNNNGIYLNGSSSNVISHNIIINCANGLYVWSSDNNTIMRNHFTPTNWNTPAYLYYSDNNTFVENIVFNSVEGGGLYVTDSDNNIFYHNNFFDNGYDPAVSILFGSYNNTWDDGYPSGGNYWLNYVGLDNYLGSNQDIPGSDGIGDSPYLIDADAQDNFPLIHPWGSVLNLNTGEIFLTIQAAINDTDTLNGHTIWVKKDTYFENVVVNKTINLTGEDRDTTIINGGGSGDAIYIITDWVNVSGFKIYTKWDDPGIELYNVSNCKVANCTLNAGILLHLSNSNTIVSTWKYLFRANAPIPRNCYTL